jgi:hypothetical protein
MIPSKNGHAARQPWQQALPTVFGLLKNYCLLFLYQVLDTLVRKTTPKWEAYRVPFRLKISSVEYADSETHISGKIIEGAYSGPESIIFVDQRGEEHSAWVTNHGVHHPEGWPVEPTHDTLLILSIAAPSPGIEVDETRPVIGCGAVSVNANRLDVTAELSDPRFWALELSPCLVSNDIPEPYDHFFGVSSQDLGDYSKAVFEEPFRQGVWPYVRLGSGGANYIEFEFTEHQERYWIGDASRERRVLMGYYSGHTSLPAFRIEEALWFLEKPDHLQQNRMAGLLCLTGCYMSRLPPSIPESLEQSVSALPSVKPDRVEQMAEVMLGNLLVPDGRWEYHRELGWINNWRHSQRNPESSMSILRSLDFRFIEEFFTEKDS